MDLIGDPISASGGQASFALPPQPFLNYIQRIRLCSLEWELVEAQLRSKPLVVAIANGLRSEGNPYRAEYFTQTQLESISIPIDDINF